MGSKRGPWEERWSRDRCCDRSLLPQGSRVDHLGVSGCQDVVEYNHFSLSYLKHLNQENDTFTLNAIILLLFFVF